MGKLIVMPQAPTTPGRGFEAGHSAEILFFTGVRYYRMTEDAAVRSKPRVTRRRAVKTLAVIAKPAVQPLVERIG